MSSSTYINVQTNVESYSEGAQVYAVSMHSSATDTFEEIESYVRAHRNDFQPLSSTTTGKTTHSGTGNEAFIGKLFTEYTSLLEAPVSIDSSTASRYTYIVVFDGANRTTSIVSRHVAESASVVSSEFTETTVDVTINIKPMPDTPIQTYFVALLNPVQHDELIPLLLTQTENQGYKTVNVTAEQTNLKVSLNKVVDTATSLLDASNVLKATVYVVQINGTIQDQSPPYDVLEASVQIGNKNLRIQVEQSVFDPYTDTCQIDTSVYAKMKPVRNIYASAFLPTTTITHRYYIFQVTAMETTNYNAPHIYPSSGGYFEYESGLNTSFNDTTRLKKHFVLSGLRSSENFDGSDFILAPHHTPASTPPGAISAYFIIKSFADDPLTKMYLVSGAGTTNGAIHGFSIYEYTGTDRSGMETYFNSFENTRVLVSGADVSGPPPPEYYSGIDNWTLLKEYDYDTTPGHCKFDLTKSNIRPTWNAIPLGVHLTSYPGTITTYTDVRVNSLTINDNHECASEVVGSSFAQTTDWYLFASYVSDLTPDEVSALAVAYPMKTGQLVDGATGSIAHTFTHVIDRNGVSIPVQSIPEYTVYMYATDGTDNGRDVQSASVTVSDQTTMLTISNMDYLNLGNELVVDWSVFDGIRLTLWWSKL